MSDIGTSDTSNGDSLSLWESSDRDNNKSGVISENSIEFSGLHSDTENDDGQHSNSAEYSVEERYKPPQKKILLDSSSGDGVLTTRMIMCSCSGRGGKMVEEVTKMAEVIKMVKAKC